MLIVRKINCIIYKLFSKNTIRYITKTAKRVANKYLNW